MKLKLFSWNLNPGPVFVVIELSSWCFHLVSTFWRSSKVFVEMKGCSAFSYMLLLLWAATVPALCSRCSDAECLLSAAWQQNIMMAERTSLLSNNTFFLFLSPVFEILTTVSVQRLGGLVVYWLVNELLPFWQSWSLSASQFFIMSLWLHQNFQWNLTLLIHLFIFLSAVHLGLWVGSKTGEKCILEAPLFILCCLYCVWLPIKKEVSTEI